MLLDVEPFAPKVVHVVHHSVEHREKSKEQEPSQKVRKVEGKIQTIGKGNTELASFFKVWNVSEHNHSLAHESSWIKWNPSSIANPTIIKCINQAVPF